MKIDLTLRITPKMAADAQGNERKALVGHLGTHFDVMDKTFPLEDTERPGLVFDVRGIRDRDIGPADVDLRRVEPGMFVAFHTGFLAEEGYGTPAYLHQHPQLSPALIDALLQAGVSLLGIDGPGLRRGKDHTPTDQRCADRGVFVIENLCRLEELLPHGGRFLAHTYPMNYAGVSGLPCRVIAEI